MNMVDKVTETLLYELFPEVSLTNKNIDHYRNIVKIVMLAMREPTFKMVEAGAVAAPMMSDVVRHSYQAMIDKALEV